MGYELWNALGIFVCLVRLVSPDMRCDRYPINKSHFLLWRPYDQWGTGSI